jgi:hypothetical protein
MDSTCSRWYLCLHLWTCAIRQPKNRHAEISDKNSLRVSLEQSHANDLLVAVVVESHRSIDGLEEQVVVAVQMVVDAACSEEEVRVAVRSQVASAVHLLLERRMQLRQAGKGGAR